MESKRNLLEIQDHVGGVFDDPLDRRELVLDALDLDGGDCRPFDRRQQSPPQRIAYGGAKTALERLGRKTAIAIGQSFAVSRQAARHLKTCPKIVLIHNVPSDNLRRSCATQERASLSEALQGAGYLL